jgi:transposase
VLLDVLFLGTTRSLIVEVTRSADRLAGCAVCLAHEVSRWRRALAAGGRAALASKGAGGARGKLAPAQLRDLEAVLDAGPAVSGWDEDQCWTLARITELIWRRFQVEYTLAGMDVLLHRIGWSVQVPARRAAERDQGRIAAWREEVWPAVKGRRRTWAPGSASRTNQARA